MYYVSQAELFRLAVLSVLLGAFFGAVWDVFRIVRIAVRGGKKGKGRLALIGEQLGVVAVFVQDVLFFAFAAVCMCIFLYRYDSGRIRGLSLFCTFLGFTAYFFTVGRLVISVAEKIVSAVRLVLRTAYGYSLKPIFTAIGKILRYIRRLFYKKHLTNRTKSYIKIIEKEAAEGFGIDISRF